MRTKPKQWHNSHDNDANPGKLFARSWVFGYHEGSHPGGTTARQCQADRPELRTVGLALSGVNRIGPMPWIGIGQRAGNANAPYHGSFPRALRPTSQSQGRGHQDSCQQKKLATVFRRKTPIPPDARTRHASEPSKTESALRKERAERGREMGMPGVKSGLGKNRKSLFHRHERSGAGRRGNNGQSGLIRTQPHGSDCPERMARGATGHPHRRRRNAAEELDA